MVKVIAPESRQSKTNVHLIDSRYTDRCCEDNCMSCQQNTLTIHHSRVLELPTIKEENSFYVPENKTLQEYEHKLSNTSVHKKRRGLIRRIKQQNVMLEEQKGVYHCAPILCLRSFPSGYN